MSQDCVIDVVIVPLGCIIDARVILELRLKSSR